MLASSRCTFADSAVATYHKIRERLGVLALLPSQGRGFPQELIDRIVQYIVPPRPVLHMPPISIFGDKWTLVADKRIGEDYYSLSTVSMRIRETTQRQYMKRTELLLSSDHYTI